MAAKPSESLGSRRGRGAGQGAVPWRRVRPVDLAVLTGGRHLDYLACVMKERVCAGSSDAGDEVGAGAERLQGAMPAARRAAGTAGEFAARLDVAEEP